MTNDGNDRKPNSSLQSKQKFWTKLLSICEAANLIKEWKNYIVPSLRYTASVMLKSSILSVLELHFRCARMKQSPGHYHVSHLVDLLREWNNSLLEIVR